MLYLVTGLPGASKSLNTLKMIIEDDSFKNRPIYYNNVKLLMLDPDVCNSFSGWFYGVYFPSLDSTTKAKVSKVLMRIHKDDELANPDNFPHLIHLFDSWQSGTGPIDLFVSWCRKLYKPSRIAPLNEYLAITEQPKIEDIKRFQLHFTNFPVASLWHELPRSSVIFIDECQQTFPPRPVGAKVPLHCSEFETHRHKGFDVFLVTQDAKLLDNHVRRLTGKHIHFFRPFGGSAISSLSADRVFDPDDYFQKKQAQSAVVKRDSKYYGLYWSADVHTHKFKLPKKLLWLIPIPLVIGSLVYYLISGAFLGSERQEQLQQNKQEIAAVSSPSASSPPVSTQATAQRRILPYVQLLSSNTPISGMCLELTYGGYQVVRRKDVQVTHFFNCVVKLPENSESKEAESTETAENQPRQLPDQGESITLDSHYFEALGFKFSFYAFTPILAYENTAYMFPRLH